MRRGLDKLDRRTDPRTEEDGGSRRSGATSPRTEKDGGSRRSSLSRPPTEDDGGSRRSSLSRPRKEKLDRRVVRQVASWCLSYPDEDLVERVPTFRAALAEHDVHSFDTFLDHVAQTPVSALEREYVEVFDVSRRHALYLSYWTDGDTRRRGEVLAGFKQRYRASGFLVDTRGELPDFLPLVLEYAAVADPEDGAALLQEYRPSLELLRIGLVEDASAYADVVAAVCATLPGVSPPDRAAVMAMAAAGPPTETVGLEPYDPRLLPVLEERRP